MVNPFPWWRLKRGLFYSLDPAGCIVAKVLLTRDTNRQGSQPPGTLCLCGDVDFDNMETP